MAKYELKTKATDVPPMQFISELDDAEQRKDAMVVMEMMEKVSGEEPFMFGPTIVAFGKYHYKYESGHEGDTCRIGFSPRKGNLVFYLTPAMLSSEKYEGLLARLGKHRTTKGCVYIRKLADVDLQVLEQIMRTSLEVLNQQG